MPPPMIAVPTTAGHIGPALQDFRRGRCPHRPVCTAPRKNTVIARSGATWQSVFPSRRVRSLCFRRRRRLPTVVPADSRPLSWPPIGALPRNRLASPATGGASPISPTPRRHAPHSLSRLRRAGCPHPAAATHRALKTPCHCEPVRTLVWQSVLPRTAPHRGNGLPRRCAPRNDILMKIIPLCVGVVVPDDPPTSRPRQTKNAE